MPTLDDLIRDQSQPHDQSGDLQTAFKEAFDLEGWQFVQQGSIPYGKLEGAHGRRLSITALQNGPALEWQLNGVAFLGAGDVDLTLEERRMRLVEAAQRAQYIAAPTPVQAGSKP